MARAILCASCQRRITSEDLALEVCGLHAHDCVNPGGHRFRVVCYADAENLDITSNRSSEWSWFPGYQWQTEACAGCGQHLGWLYSHADHRFHGLIEGRVVAEGEGATPAP
jgi:hypothetical protein